MTKDKQVAVRINKKVKELLKKDGITCQKIIDEFIEKYFKVEEKITRRKK